MAEINTVIAEASQDLQTIEDFVNLPAGSDVRPRLLPSVNVGTLSGTRDAIFRAGGLPAEPFETKAQMETDGAALTDGKYAMVTDDTVNNGLYVKTAGSWVKSDYDPIIQANEFSTVYTDAMLGDLFDISYNLVDPSKALPGHVISSSGEVLENSQYEITDFIPVVPNETYTLFRDTEPNLNIATFFHVSYYDSRKVFIERQTIPIVSDTGKLYQTIKTGSNVGFVRLSVNQGSVSQYKRMMYKGDDERPYEPYKTPVLLADLAQTTKDDVIDTAVNKSSDYFDTKINQVLDVSYNLVDPSKAVKDKSYTSDGNLIDISGYWLSDFIVVKPDTDYTLYRNSEIASNVATYTTATYFDKDKVFIKQDGFAIINVVGVVRDISHSPENARYIRVSVQDSSIDRFSRMLHEGSDELDYQAYYPPRIGDDGVDRDMVAEIFDSKIDDFTVKSKNIFNPDDVTAGKVINSSGVIADAPAGQVYWVTGYIAIEPNTQYVFSANQGTTGFVHTAFFDKDKNFIIREGTATNLEPSGSRVITTPANAHFLRTNMNERLPYQTNRMIRKAGTSPDYEPYHDGKVSEFTLNDDVLESSEITGVEWLSRNFLMDVAVTETYNAPLTWDYTSGYYQQPHTVVHAMFDELLTLDNENYVTKSVLGSDDFGNDIPLFTFKPAVPVVGVDKQLPKFLVVCGTHGFEQVPPLATYLMMKEVITNWESDPALELLRHNVELLVIPVLNPSGWDDFTRKNRNGVDLNRSFTPDFGWQTIDPANSWYGGTTPLQEKESQCVKKVFDDNLDIIACYDFHNFHGNDSGSYNHYIWIPTKSAAVRRLTQTLVTKMTRKWRKEFDWFPEAPYFAGFSEEYSGAMIQDYAMSRGAQLVATMEVGETWWVNPALSKFDTTHCKTATEVLVNWLVLNLQILDKMHAKA